LKKKTSIFDDFFKISKFTTLNFSILLISWKSGT